MKLKKTLSGPDLVWLRESEPPPRPPALVIKVEEPSPAPSPVPSLVPSLKIEYGPHERRMRMAKGASLN